MTDSGAIASALYREEATRLRASAVPLGQIHPRWNDAAFWDLVAEQAAADARKYAREAKRVQAHKAARREAKS